MNRELWAAIRKRQLQLWKKGCRSDNQTPFFTCTWLKLMQAGRTADARWQLNAIISMTPDQNNLPEYKEAVGDARKLLEKLEHSVQDRTIKQSPSPLKE
jgi:hypothetical protein